MVLGFPSKFLLLYSIQQELHQTDLSTPAIPSHSQNNERAVSNTTEAVEKAIGHDNQKAPKIETDKSRLEIPTQSTKHNLNLD